MPRCDHIISGSFQKEPPAQPPTFAECLPCGMMGFRIGGMVSDVQRHDAVPSQVLCKPNDQEARVLQTPPVPAPPEHPAAASEVSFGPLLAGVTLLALMLRNRR